jgi:hypothetical protein
LSLLEGGPLLLELAFRLLMRALLLAKLLLHCGERRDLFLQVGTQLLGLLGLLLCRSLPGPRPLEGGAVLLELVLRRNKGGLLLRHHGLRLGQGGTHLLQLDVRRHQHFLLL